MPSCASGAAMEGGGFYNRHSGLQAAAIEMLLPYWEEAARAVPFGDEPLVLADYGSSQGRNSMLPMQLAIAALRHRAGADRPIQIVHTDLPSNDFASLFVALDQEPCSYLADTRQVFPSAVGRSYFEQILPDATVHLAWNSWTLQWASRKIGASDHCFAVRGAQPQVLAAAEQQQEADWRQFLLARSAELRPGARLVSLTAARHPGRTGWAWVGDTMWSTLVAMGQAGLIAPEERQRITIPTVPLLLSQIEQPFADGAFAGLELLRAEIMDAPDPYWPAYQASGDAAQLGRSLADMCRGFAGPTMLAALDPGRDREAFLDDYFDRLAAALAATAQRHEHYIAIIVLTKTE